MKKISVFILMMLLMSVSVNAEHGVFLETVTNTLDDTTLHAGNSHSFQIRYTNDSAYSYNTTTGFRIYSPDGATWGSTTGNWLNGFDANFTSAFINPGGVTGADADTIGFGGITFSPTGGLTAGFDGVVLELVLTGTNVSDVGKHICIDSTFYQPSNSWKWAPFAPNPQISPPWDGPHCFVIKETLTDVPTKLSGLPTEFALEQNYPNPFNPTTTIEFAIPQRTDVSLKVFNVLGQEVKSLIGGSMDVGFYVVDWDGTSNTGAQVSSGIYFYKLEAKDYVKTNKMMLLK